MLLLLFTLAIILTAITVWTINRLLKYGQMTTIELIVGSVVIFFLQESYLYLLAVDNKEALSKVMNTVMGMVSCCFLPTIYLIMRKICHLKKLCVSSVCLYLLALLNIFSKITVYTDNIPVEQITGNAGVDFYSEGKDAAFAEVSELIIIIQLIWILERILRFCHKIVRDDLKLTKKAKMAIACTNIYAIIALVCLIVPYSYDTHRYVCFAMLLIDYIGMAFLVIIVGSGDDGFFVTDVNDEMVYLSEVPNVKKMKRKFDLLFSDQKIHRNEELSIANVAKILDTNSSTIAEMLKEECDTTFNAYLTKVRIEDAMDLIRYNKKMPLGEIASTCGFNSAVNFSKAFKKVMGMTAREWSERI